MVYGESLFLRLPDGMIWPAGRQDTPMAGSSTLEKNQSSTPPTWSLHCLKYDFQTKQNYCFWSQCVDFREILLNKNINKEKFP